jgi:hypothetical protein
MRPLALNEGILGCGPADYTCAGRKRPVANTKPATRPQTGQHLANENFALTNFLNLTRFFAFRCADSCRTQALSQA